MLCSNNMEGAHKGTFILHTLLGAAVENAYDGLGEIKCESITHEYMLRGLASKVGIRREAFNDKYDGSNLMTRLEQRAKDDDFSYNQPITVKYVDIGDPQTCDLDNDGLVRYLNSESQKIADAKKTQAYKPECMTIADALEWAKILLVEFSNTPEDIIDYAQYGYLHVPPKNGKIWKLSLLVIWSQTIVGEMLFTTIPWKTCVHLRLHWKLKQKTQTSL